MPENGSANHEPLNQFYSRLATRLIEPRFGLARWDKNQLDTLWKPDEKKPPPQRAVIEMPELRIAGYLDLNPGLLIVDSKLGTLGLVYRLCGDFESLAHSIIDQATYLKHLLVMDAGADSHRPYTVECVLSFTSGDAEPILRNVFRDTARDTAFWHAIGVNVLVCADRQPITDPVMTRAFSWLLSNACKWFNDPPPPPPNSVVHTVSLANYRLPGTRTLTLHREATVHLIHGQNGAGKSSIAEALELSVTGKAVRLEARSAKDYAAVIRNRQTTQSPNIVLEFDPPGTWSSPVGATGVASPLNSKLPVSSFRLDQDAMDTLAREGPEKRAEIFLRSFFPEDAGVHVALDKARETLDSLSRVLPPEIQTTLATLSPDKKPDAILTRFDWLAQSRPPTIDECRDCEPLSRESLDLLRALAPEIGVYLDAAQFKDMAHFDELFSGLDKALERVRARAGGLAEAIRASRQCLAEPRVLNWMPAATAGSTHDWLTLLEKWSEHIAMADLADKHWQLSKTLADGARAIGRDSLEVSDLGLFAETEASLSGTLAGLEQLKKQFAEERDKLYAQIIEFSMAPSAGNEKPVEPPNLSDRQIRALNFAGETLTTAAPTGTTESAEKLGTTMDQAFSQNKHLSFAGAAIGVTGWAPQLAARFDQVAKALATMVNDADQIETRSQSTASYIGPLQRKETLKAALDAANAVKAAAAKTQSAFLNELRNQNLNEALNELMALFTPARWAYEDVEVRQKSAGGKENLELGISGSKDSQAELVLNTAELNVFTVSLYLLAAVRVPNPLGILLFDDPLQNMDELTVTTLARGLAKVLRVFPAKWQLVFLFHGEDDLERFRQEVPAAVYLLPWLAPSAALADALQISAEPLKSTYASALQNLAAIVKTRTA